MASCKLQQAKQGFAPKECPPQAGRDRRSSSWTPTTSRRWCAARILEEVEEVARGSSPEIDVEHEFERGSASFTSVARLVYEKANLLVRRPGEPALLAKRPRRSNDGRDALGARLEAADEPDDTNVSLHRRDDHSSHRGYRPVPKL